jgi:hypothetical protein
VLIRFLSFILLICEALYLGAKDKPEKSGPVRFSHDAGILIGGAYYLGELNPSRHFYMMQPALGLFYRYNKNYRFSYLVGLNFGSIMGDDSQSDDIDQLNRNLNFKSKLKELHAVAEFNFWDYRIGNNKKYFAPFLFAGFALLRHNPIAVYKGNEFELQPLSTEGQGTPLDGKQKPYKLTQFTLPFGIGAKLNLSHNVGISFEWGMRKTYTDYLDDVSKQYVNRNLLAAFKGNTAALLSDRSLDTDVLNHAGAQRGNPGIKDWYNFFGFKISVQINRVKKCSGAYGT